MSAKISSVKKPVRQKIYDGSSKIIYKTEEEYTLVQFFKDELKYKDQTYHISGKGVINNSISALLMERLDLVGIENHMIEKLNMREQLIQIVDIIPIQVKVSNVAVDNYVTQFGVQQGYLFQTPMIEFRAKNPLANNPIINENQVIGFNWATRYEVKQLQKQAHQVNTFLTGFFAGCGLRLVECYLEFGRVYNTNDEDFFLMLADELTIESCRLWELDSNDQLDLEFITTMPDRAIEVYKTVAKRIGIRL